MQNVIVTGGSRGLGLAICKQLTASGYRAIAIARRETEELKAAGNIAFQPYDLGDIDGMPQLMKTIRQQHGPIHGLVNNAGIGTEGLLSAMPIKQIEELIRLNTLSPIALTRQAIRSMMAEGKGRIVNMSSIIASTGYSALSVYGATKASMVGFTKSLARELGRAGITVNAVAPGFIETAMTDGLGAEQKAKIASRSAMKRLAEPQDVASAVDFLMGEGAKNITGTVITVDAGNTA